MEDLGGFSRNQDNEDDLSYGFLEFDDESSNCFTLKNIDMKSFISRDLIAFTASEECILMATRKNKIIRKKAAAEDDYESFNIAAKPKSEVYKICADLCGFHSLILMTKGEHFYLPLSKTELVPLPKLQGLELTSVAYPTITSMKNTGEMLLGCKDGTIWGYSIEIGQKGEIIENGPRKIYQLPQESVIYGICYETYDYMKISEKVMTKSTLVIAVTNDTMYQFIGSLPFDKLFEKYANNPTELNKDKKSVPKGKIEESELKLYHEFKGKNQYELHSFAWKCGAGICYGEFRKKSDVEVRVNIKEITIEAYKKKGSTNEEIPESIGITEYNLYFLYMNNLTIVSKITKEIEHGENFRSDEGMKNIVFDPSGKSMWLSSIKGVHRLFITGENRDLWKQMLESGAFEDAISECKKSNPKYVDYITGLYADSKFKEGKFKESAILYAQSSKKFEEIILKFIMAGQTEGLQCIVVVLYKKP